MPENRPSPSIGSSRLTALALAALASATHCPAEKNGEYAVSLAEGEAPLQLPAVTVSGGGSDESVSSPKFTEPVSDIPQTIAVIPPGVYNAQGATTLTDVLRNTPGITVFAGEGGGANRTGGDSFYLRGFDTSNSLFLDGVRDEGAAVHDVFDIEQVEVHKGPSAENGRGGTAGYINLETKTPKLSPFQDLEYMRTLSSEGSLSSDRVSLDVDTPVPALGAGAAMRAELVDQQGGAPGRQFVENDRWGVAPSIALGLGTATRAIATYEHLYEHNLPDYGVPSTALPGHVPAGMASYFSPGVDLSNYYGFVDYDYEHVTRDAEELRLEHDFAHNVRAANQTRFDVTSRKVEASAPSGSVTVAPAGQAGLSQGIYQTRNTILSNQSNLSATLETGPVQNAVTAGLELSRESADNPTWAVTDPGVPNPNYVVSIYAPADFPAALKNYDPHLTGTETKARIDTAALYAFDTAKIGRQWELVGGVRLERYEADELSVTAGLPAVPASPALPGTGGAPATAPAAAAAAVPASKANFSSARADASWKTGLVYKPEAEGTLYASYDTSLRPPGTSAYTNTLSATATSADNPLLEPERAQNYEVGVKWDFLGDRLLVSAAAFRSVNSNVPAADPVSGIVSQSSDQTVSGVEFGLSGNLTKEWMVFAGYAHMRARVSAEISADAQGLTLPLLPTDSGNLWTTYDLPRGVTLGAGIQYMGPTERLQASNAPTATTFGNGVPDYWLLGAMVSWHAEKHLTLRLNLNNIADRSYVASLNNNGYRLNPGPPRTVMLSAEIRY